MAVPKVLDSAAQHAWRLIVIAIATLGGLWLVRRLSVVVLALVLALFMTRALGAPVARLRRRLRPSAAAGLGLVGFLVVVAASMALIGAAVASELDDIGPTLSSGIDDLEDWLVDDSPFDVSRTDIDDFRDSIGERASGALRDSGGSIISGAVLAAEVVLSILLGLILTFFALKDGDRLLAFVRSRVPADRVGVVTRVGERAWRTLGGYLRGAAALGVVEGTIIGITLWLVGAELAVPMAVLTFIAAFVPFVGAIAAALVAVLVALGTGGFVPALIVAGVALVVQQLDNDLLAPIVYGRALDLHPVIVLLAITSGGALFGIVGSILAVPVVAVVWNSVAEARIPDQEIS